MTREEILAFLNANPICFLATAEDCKPHVRGMMLFRADERGIIFHTGEGKDMTIQMHNNPLCEVCVWDQKTNIQVRVSGAVEFLDDLEMKKQLVAERPFLQPMVDQFGYDAFAVFRVKDCVATVWTMAEAMAPKTFVKLCGE